METRLSELIPALQVSIGPVILISGVGLLLLSLTNRFGRAADRSRQVNRELRQAGDADRQQLTGQVRNLYRRARLIKTAIIFAATSILFAAVLIITLFFVALMKLEFAIGISVLFVGCLCSLVLSLIAFIRDIQLSLEALRLEFGVGSPRDAE